MAVRQPQQPKANRAMATSTDASPQAPKPRGGYLYEVWTELKKVTWPTPQEAWRLTMVVLGLIVIVGVIIGALDFVLSAIFRKILK